MGKAAKITLGLVGVVAVIGIATAASGGSDDSEGKPAAQPAQSADAASKRTPAEEFKAFVDGHGTATEKRAVKHVTKVHGAEEQNDVLDAPEIYTDYSGGITGPHQTDGKLIASAFADWKHSKNGVVTVYDKDGEILSNGEF